MRAIFIVMLGLVSGMAYAIDTTGTYLFNESTLFPTGHPLLQTDPRLANLFGANGKSALCGPTTLANIFSYQKTLREPNYNLTLATDPSLPDYYTEIDDLFTRCATDKNNGTLIVNMMACTRALYQSSGYNQPVINLITNPSLADIKTAVQKNYGVILEVGFYSFNPTNQTWSSTEGHYVWVAGFEDDPSFAGQSMILKVVNPEQDYSQRAANNSYDDIHIFVYPRKSGQIYPSHTTYILDGVNFRGFSERAFVRYLIVVNPVST